MNTDVFAERVRNKSTGIKSSWDSNPLSMFVATRTAWRTTCDDWAFKGCKFSQGSSLVQL